ncbi:hypothetical protein D3C83_182400 [compost metagenome]
MLEQRIHRHHKKAGQRPDQDHERDGDLERADEIHRDDDQPHGDADRHYVDRAVEGHEPCGGHRPDRDADRADAL